MIHRKSVYLVLASALGGAPIAAAQNLTPTVAFSVHDEPRDGLGDSFNAMNLIRTQSNRADRAMQEFDVSSLAGTTILSATLEGRVTVNNAFNNGVRTFDFAVYAGNGVADLTDYEIAATVIGSGQYMPPVDSFFDYSFDIAPALQRLVDAGATHLGLRVEGTSNPNFPNILSTSVAELTISAGASIGTNYCVTNPNASGVPATISATGSSIAAVNDLTLHAANLPQQQFGIFIVSEMQGFIPGTTSSNGHLCLSGMVDRFILPSQIQNSGTQGTFALQIDLTAIPRGTTTVAVMTGDTLNFQAWFRDPFGFGSNFTNGLEIVFQ